MERLFVDDVIADSGGMVGWDEAERMKLEVGERSRRVGIRCSSRSTLVAAMVGYLVMSR